MTNFQIKLIAIITMLTDHIGAMFMTMSFADLTALGISLDFLWFLRQVGRIAFPVFAYLIAEGCMKTSDIKAYVLRLGLFALISQLPFTMFLRVGLFDNFNIFVTLTLGALAVFTIQKTKYWVISVFALGFFAEFINADYGSFGVWIIAGIYLIKAKSLPMPKIWESGAIIILLLILYPVSNEFMRPMFIGGLFSLIPVVLYNGILGFKGFKWLFYVFYPAHLLILALIRDYITAVF